MAAGSGCGDRRFDIWVATHSATVGNPLEPGGRRTSVTQRQLARSLCQQLSRTMTKRTVRLALLLCDTPVRFVLVFSS